MTKEQKVSNYDIERYVHGLNDTGKEQLCKQLLSYPDSHKYFMKLVLEFKRAFSFPDNNDKDMSCDEVEYV